MFFALQTTAQSSTNPEIYLQRYQDAISKGDNTTAFQSILQWYNDTHSFESAIILAGLFIEGNGIEQNIENAAILYKSVADATQYDPNNENALIMIGFSARQYALMDYNLKGYFSPEAISYLKKADEISEDAMALYFLGIIYIGDEDLSVLFPNSEKKDIEKGLMYLKKSAQRNCIAALTELGDLYDQYGEKDLAFECWEKASRIPLIEATPNTSDALSYLVNPNNSAEMMTILAQNEAFYRVSRYYSDMNDIDHAYELAEKITVEDPIYIDQKAFCYAANGQKQKAIDTYMHEYEISKDTSALARLAITHYTLWNDKDEAIRLLQYIMSLGDTKAQTIIDMINSGEY